MKKISALLLTATISGCVMVPDKNVDSLTTPNGNGALAILTTFSDKIASQACNHFSLEMFNKIDNSKKVLNFYPDADKKYVLFDNLEKGSYVIKSILCFPRNGYVFSGNKLYLEQKVSNRVLIKPNHLTLSKDSLSGVVYEDGTFSLNFARSAQSREFLQQIIDKEVKTGWSFYTHE